MHVLDEKCVMKQTQKIDEKGTDTHANACDVLWRNNVDDAIKQRASQQVHRREFSSRSRLARCLSPPRDRKVQGYSRKSPLAELLPRKYLTRKRAYRDNHVEQADKEEENRTEHIQKRNISP